MSELPATIRILERPYKMRINADDEQYLRQAAALIDSQAKNYSKKYACTDRQDLLAMVALTHITQLLKLQTTHRFEDTQLEDRQPTGSLGQIVGHAALLVAPDWDASHTAEQRPQRPEKPLLLHQEVAFHAAAFTVELAY